MQAYWMNGPWPGRLAIVPRPRGGEWLADDVAAWKSVGIGLVVSALTTEETAAFELQEEARVCRANGISFVSIPIDDRGVPSSHHAVLELLTPIELRLAKGETVAVHCRQGLGRAPLIAACLLVLAGVEADDAFRPIGKARGTAVPETRAQTDWLREFAQKDVSATNR